MFDATRRSFLGKTAGAAALAAAGGKLAAQEYRMGGADLKLGIASYSFRKFSREKAIEMTKELGTPYLNVKDFHLKLDSTPEEIDAAKKEFADAGITLVGCGNVSFNKDDDADMRSKIRICQARRIPADCLRAYRRYASETRKVR